jgi:hypothetical protein
MLKNGAKTFTLVARYSTVFGILKIRESADFYDSILGMERFKFQHR